MLSPNSTVLILYCTLARPGSIFRNIKFGLDWMGYSAYRPSLDETKAVGMGLLDIQE
jgi:hypothetical protein